MKNETFMKLNQHEIMTRSRVTSMWAFYDDHIA